MGPHRRPPDLENILGIFWCFTSGLVRIVVGYLARRSILLDTESVEKGA